ncbi:MAG: S8 family serine peptidase, partial [Chloroflexi bacterium]|nr:S8 family serine peptidase [Chloroflexota bacterium]
SWGEFAGTSASAPHVAGAAALVWGAYPYYSAAQVCAFLEGRAVDMGSLGRDTQYGYGRLSLGAAPLRLWLPLIQR